jgi:hypothetical protein
METTNVTTNECVYDGCTAEATTRDGDGDRCCAAHSVDVESVSGTELYHRYPRQTEPQDAYVWLNCKTRRLGAEYNPEIGNAVPTSVYHGHVQRWTIPTLKGAAATALLESLAPLAARVCDGYSSEWDGSNHVAEFTADAEAAREEIERLCEDADGERDGVVVWEAADWLGGIGGLEAQAAELGITAATTDAQLETIETECVAEARGESVDEIEGLWAHLKRVRDAVRDAE